MPTVRVDCPKCGHVDNLELRCWLDSGGDASVPGGIESFTDWEVVSQLCACDVDLVDLAVLTQDLICEDDRADD